MSWINVENYSPNAMRSGCLICANGEVRQTASGREPILSSGFEDEWAGTPEICATCIGEAAQMLGWFSGPAYAKEVEQRKAAQERAELLSEELVNKTATITVLVAELAAATEARQEVEPVRAKARAGTR